MSEGVSPAAADEALAHARIDRKVLAMDRGQAVFKQTFLEFSKRSVNGYRLRKGKEKLPRDAAVFKRAEAKYGVPAAVITAFWGLETDYGAVQGDFNTIDALVTMSHDCRRPDLFRPQLIAAIRMVQEGDLDPQRTTGAWAGEIGQVQMLPQDIVRYGIDGDGDGHVRLKTDDADVIMTAANFINALGWRANEPWLQEVEIPDHLPWAKTGLQPGMTVGDWEAAGVRARTRPAAGRQPGGRPHHAAGPPRPDLPRLSQLQRLSEVEQVVHLHHDGRLFRHPAGRRAAL